MNKNIIGPQTTFAKRLYKEKYCGEGETFEEVVTRVASTLKDDDEHYSALREILLNMRFMPGGRVQSAIGSTKNVTAYNCFVSGTIRDSFVEGENSIMEVAKQAAQTMRMGGGIGYDFSTLRPRGDLIKKLQSYSSGAVSFMHIYNAVCGRVSSAGHRRGAQMGVIRIDHPDIEEFIRSKHPSQGMQDVWDMVEDLEECDRKNDMKVALQSTLALSAFNISVAITDRFMKCLINDKPFPLKFNGKIYREVDPRWLWDELMRSTWDWDDPGVLFVDRINEMNNLHYCETIVATNPCGEQPLPPYGACLLGSFNLTRYLYRDTFGRYSFDYDQFDDDVRVVVMAMDNVPEKSRFPLEEQRVEAYTKRRMGIGVTGLANTGEALGFEYGSDNFCRFENHILSHLKNVAYKTSVEVARKKGVFKLFDKDKYLESKFIKTLDEDTVDLIAKYGIRNSHLTSIAPTGTISMCADNVSSGIEPVFAYNTKRQIIDFNGPRIVDQVDYGHAFLGVNGKRCADVTVDEHLKVLFTAAANVDSAVSKTCNLPSDITWEDFKDIYVRAWDGGAKGCTTYRDAGSKKGIIESNDEGKACRIDPTTGRKECD